MQFYYLPGDLIDSLFIKNKEFDKALNKISEKIKIIMIYLSPVTNNVFKQFIRMTQNLDPVLSTPEEIERAKLIELNELSMSSDACSIEKLIEHLKDNENFENKKIYFSIPAKCIRATRVNRTAHKTIYYHIRSNC